VESQLARPCAFGFEAVGLSIRRPIDVANRIDESSIVEDRVGLEGIAGEAVVE
jgi:hypothetical protein